MAALPPFDRDPFAQALSAMLALALDELDYGILIVDRMARVLRANHRARRLCAEANSTCWLDGDRLRIRLDADAVALQQALTQAAGQSRRCLLRLGPAGRSQSVAVVPLDVGLEPAVLLVFSKRQVCETLSVDHFARVHGLTPAEGQVLTAICEGSKPQQIAERFGVAVSTVRTHILAIRNKTRTASIRDLVREVAVLPPIVSALGRGPAH